jgi:hypothetical protein
MHPELAYIVMRPAFMAAEHFEADFAVGTRAPSTSPSTDGRLARRYGARPATIRD